MKESKIPDAIVVPEKDHTYTMLPSKAKAYFPELKAVAICLKRCKFMMTA